MLPLRGLQRETLIPSGHEGQLSFMKPLNRRCEKPSEGIVLSGLCE
jgi:hypothetical protein